MKQQLRIGLAINHSYAFWRNVLRGIGCYAETKPRWLFVSIVPEQQSVSVLRSKIDGLLVSIDTLEMVQALKYWRRPVVNVSDVLFDLTFPRVGPDNVQVGRLAADHFLARGLRHFGYFGPQGQMYAVERQQSFDQALADVQHTCSHFHIPTNLPFDVHNRRWDINQAAYRWLRKLPKPVGVFTPCDNWGVQLLEACRHLELRVPEDVAVLGVDDDELDCDFARPRLSSVMLPAERIGYSAAELLDRLLARKAATTAATLLPSPGVATRQSTDILAIEDSEVIAAVRFIREHAHVPMQVADVLQEVPVGRRTLELRFRESLNRSIAEEIRRVHLERAQRLLARTELPIQKIAVQAGFSDFRHMANVFQQALGKSPTAYRRQLRVDSAGHP